MFFAHFSLSDSRCMSDAVTSTKLERTGEIFWDGQCCMGICILSPVHESEMRGYLAYVLIVKYLSHRFCLNSARVYIRLEGLIVEFGGGFFQTFLEGSVDHVVYRD